MLEEAEKWKDRKYRKITLRGKCVQTSFISKSVAILFWHLRRTGRNNKVNTGVLNRPAAFSVSGVNLMPYIGHLLQ